MYLVSAYFDEKTNMILQRYIDQIAEKTGNGFHMKKGLAVCFLRSKK